MPDVQVENGIVTFKNVGQYRKTIKLLSTYNNIQLNNWAKTMDFYPYNLRAEDAVDSLWNLSSESELNVYMKRFQDFMTARIRDGELYHELIVQPNIFTSVGNKDGLYIIGKKAYRILGNYMLETNSGQIEKLLAVHYPNINNNNVPSGIKIKKYMEVITFKNMGNNYKNVPIGGDSIPIGGNGGTTTDTTKSSNSQPSTLGHITVTNTNPSSNREIILTAYADGMGNSAYNDATYDGYIDATAEKPIWWKLGSWGEYNTEIIVQGTSNSDKDFSMQTPWGVNSYLVGYWDSNLYGGDCADFHITFFPHSVWTSYPGPPMYLLSAHVKAWTRGTEESYCADIEYDLY